MIRLTRKEWLRLILLLSSLSGKAYGQASGLEEKFLILRDTTTWKQVTAISLAFPAHHPQGMVKVGPYFYMSSVEVHDRAAGKGVGHLFKFDSGGKLIADLRLGEGAMYHPGGIDYDGEAIWIPVAEYRPDSKSIVYKVDPASLTATEVFRFADHLGGIVHDTDSHTLHGINWGSRDYYSWKFDSNDSIINESLTGNRRIANPSFYIDYQDCHCVGNNRMLCGGLKNYRNANSVFRLGGLELVDLSDHSPVHQIPVQLWSPSGKPMTQNPFWLESTEQGIKAYFVPDDEQATMFVFEIELPKMIVVPRGGR